MNEAYQTPKLAEGQTLFCHAECTPEFAAAFPLNPEATHTIFAQSKEKLNRSQVLSVALKAGIPLSEMEILQHQESVVTTFPGNVKSNRCTVDFIAKGFKSRADQGAAVKRTYLIDKGGVLLAGPIVTELHKYDDYHSENENLRVVIYADNVEKIYTLAELMELTGLHHQVLEFQSSLESGALPDERRYIIHMKRELPVIKKEWA